MNAIATEQQWADALRAAEEKNRKLRSSIEDILQDLVSIDAVGMYFDRNWQKVRETGRVAEDDERYVRHSELLEVVAKVRYLLKENTE